MHNSIIKWLVTLESYNSIQSDYNVCDLLLRKKYRTASVDPDFKAELKVKIENAVTNSTPLHFTVPFGGFKKWQLPTAPHVDWAEVINIRFLIEYLIPICKIHKPGIILEYFSDEIFVNRINYYPNEHLDIYNKEFRDLIEWFKPLLPNNFDLRFSKIRDQISQEELFKRLDDFLPETEQAFLQYTEEQKQKLIEKTKRNIYIPEGTSITQKQLLNSVYLHEVFSNEPWDKGVPWAFDNHMIPIGFYKTSWGLPMKSSPSSRVQFWVGIGAFKSIGDRLIPTILSYEQLKDTKLRSETIRDLNGMESALPHLSTVMILD